MPIFMVVKKVIAYILVSCIMVLAMQPAVVQISSLMQKQSIYPVSCCARPLKQKQDANDCCQKGLCNPFAACACCSGCIIASPIKLATRLAATDNAFQEAQYQRRTSRYQVACWHPPEIA